MRSYEAARGYFSFLSFVAWCAILGGLLLALGVGFPAAQITRGLPIVAFAVAAMPGIFLMLIGFFGLVYVQTARATVDSAEYAQQTLKLAREQHHVGKQLLALAQASEEKAGYEAVAEAAELTNVSYDTDPPKTDTPKSEPLIPPEMPIASTYKGQRIQEFRDFVLVDDDRFSSLEAARTAIDKPYMRSTLRLSDSVS